MRQQEYDSYAMEGQWGPHPESTLVIPARSRLDRFMDIARRGASYAPWGSIHFTETGMMQLGVISGFIRGVLEYNPGLARRLAEDLGRELDALDNYGGPISEGGTARRYIVGLSSDNSLFSFSICYYGACNFKDEDREHYYIRPGERYAYTQTDWSTPDRGPATYWYKFVANGGLIYHGGGNETFAVRLDNSSLWARHH